MRINVYTEELLTAEDPLPFAEIVTADYVSSRTGEQMTNYGLRIFLKSPPELHYIPGRDDDRSAVTFWCGPSKKNVFVFLDIIHTFAKDSDMKLWRKKTEEVNKEAVKAERLRKLGEAARTADPDCKYCDGTGRIWKDQVGGGDWEQCSCLTIARVDGTIKPGDTLTGDGYPGGVIVGREQDTFGGPRPTHRSVDGWPK